MVAMTATEALEMMAEGRDDEMVDMVVNAFEEYKVLLVSHPGGPTPIMVLNLRSGSKSKFFPLRIEHLCTALPLLVGSRPIRDRNSIDPGSMRSLRGVRFLNSHMLRFTTSDFTRTL